MTTSEHGLERKLVDPHGRTIDYVRLSVTDKCNLRCFYCMPKGCRDFAPRDNYLSFDETVRIIRAFSELGVKRVRITGGEPLIRKNLPDLARRLSELPGITDLSLSSNAVLLADQAEALRAAGVERLNISLDTLNPQRFAEITGGDDLQRVLDGLYAARAAGFGPIKINMLALKSTSDEEVIDMVEFCMEHHFSLRFIETMPMGDTGRTAADQYVSLQAYRELLEQHYQLVPSVMRGGGPATYMRVRDSDLHIGFITPISRHFCETCNRVRLSVEGVLYLCLGQERSVPLRPLLRDGIDDAGLRAAIVEALKLKPARHEFREKPEQIIRFMSATGG